GQCKRGSVRAPVLAGSCRARGALTQAWVQDPAESRRILQDSAEPDGPGLHWPGSAGPRPGARARPHPVRFASLRGGQVVACEARWRAAPRPRCARCPEARGRRSCHPAGSGPARVRSSARATGAAGGWRCARWTRTRRPCGSGRSTHEDWRTLRRAPPAVRACRGLVLAAAAQDPRALQYARESLWEDPAFAVECLRVSGGRAAPFLPAAHRQDRAVMMEAVALDGLALNSVYGTELRADAELVRVAVRQNWAALQFASEALRQDRELALEAVRISWEAVEPEEAAEQIRGRRVCTVPRLRLPRRRRSSAQEWYGAQFCQPAEPDRLCAPCCVGAGSEGSPNMLRCTGVALAIQRVLPEHRADLSEPCWAPPAPPLAALRAPRAGGRPSRLAPRRPRGAPRAPPSRGREAVALLPAELHADRGVMLEALRQSGEALRYAAEELRADPALVREAEERGWAVAATGEERNYHSLNFAEEVRLPPMGSSSWAA
ncbi:unnamed protein product, partial [Prorocentrum cordatum]